MRKLFNENGANYKHFSKKITVGFITATLLLTAFSGCGDKTVDYGLDKETAGDGSEADSGTLAEKYNIPDEINVSIDVGDSTLTKIEINDEDITYPDTSSMDIAFYKKKEFNSETKKNLAETVFDKDEGIYVYDEENPTKSDLQDTIERYKVEKEEALNNGDADSAAVSQEMIDMLTEQLDSAPDEYGAAGDYSESRYIGTIDGREYCLQLYENYSYLYIRENKADYRPLVGAEENISCYSTSSGDFDAAEIEDLENMCSLSEEEALNIAEDFMSNIGFDDMILTKTDGLYWNYYNCYTVETDTIELDGYTFFFSRAIDNSAVSAMNPTNASNFANEGESLELPSEKFTISIDANGIVEANWTWYLESTGETEENVKLLSFDELLDAANENISEYYVAYPTNYTKIEFNKMELTYFPEETDEEGVFKYVPAWILSEFEVYQDSSGEEYPYQIVVIDATNGEVIDLLSLAKALGTYESYE